MYISQLNFTRYVILNQDATKKQSGYYINKHLHIYQPPYSNDETDRLILDLITLDGRNVIRLLLKQPSDRCAAI